jgi:hypothetical protein
MQIKCSYCSTPFALNKEQLAEAVEIFKQDKSAHYDAHCPKCRRAVRVVRKTLEVNPVTRKLLEA